MLHANAGDGKHLYGSMTSAWQRAVSSGSTVLTLYSAYFRGIAHHGRQETALALVRVSTAGTGRQPLPDGKSECCLRACCR